MTRKLMVDPMNNQGDAFTQTAAEFGVELEMHEGEFNSDRVRTLIYGMSGAGKTRFAATWPSVVFLNIDDGLASVDWSVGNLRIRTKEELDASLMFLESGRHPFKSVVLDSMNELQVLLMTDTKSRYPAIRRPYDDLASQSDYGKMLSDFDKYVRQIKALPYNTIFIANSLAIENDTDVIKPQLIGKATADAVCRMMDIVGYLYPSESTDGVRSTTFVVYAPQYVTKDRSGRLPSFLTDPTYDQLNQLWSR